MGDLPHANSVVFPGVAAPAASGADVPIQVLSTVPDGRALAGWYPLGRLRPL